jgi:hypothetical protein
MNRSRIVVVALGLCLLALNLGWRQPQDKRDIQAILVKVVKDVTKKGPTAGWQQAIPLDRLRSGYQVRTQEGSLAMIRFADETKLVVRQKSIVEIKGQVQGKQILDRNIYLERGNVQFNVKKQQTEQFRFASPISVASIRGTDGAFIAGDDSTDLLIILQGLATLTNLISNQSQDVGSGQTGKSDSEGNLDVNDSSPEEINDASQTVEESNEFKQEEEQKPAQTQPKIKKTLRIPGEDNNGKTKTIIIEWEE